MEINLITLDDMGILSSGLLSEINLTPFQYWASDIDFTNSISILTSSYYQIVYSKK